LRQYSLFFAGFGEFVSFIWFLLLVVKLIGLSVLSANASGSAIQLTELMIGTSVA
jgi:hypothetical protein